ncbi:MAG: PKD domain-containing protein [Acidimicrobiia bacterium]|nr:PKD domain-containing protein [Acidimicrobiia bacterium]
MHSTMNLAWRQRFLAPLATISLAPNYLDVAFDGYASRDRYGASPSSYFWDFGDGGQAAVVNPTHSYAGPGTYAVTLTVTDPLGVVGTATQPVTVSSAPNEPPNAAFTMSPPSGAAPLQVDLDASASIDPDGTITSYEWDFGDGETSTGVSATHIFTAPGDYTVILTVQDDDGATDIEQQAIQVVAAPADTLSVVVSGGYSYAYSGAIASGNLAVAHNGDGTVRSVSGSATFPGERSGNATFAVSAQQLWILPIYLGNVTVTDLSAGIRLSTPILLGQIRSVGLAGATGTNSWFDLSRWPWKSYTLTWTVNDLA